MSDQVIVKVAGEDYPLDFEQTMADLTGEETVQLEEYLGGWEKFDLRGATTRSVIVLIWLAKRQAGKHATLEQIAQTKGLIFGDAFDIVEVKDGPPVVAPDSGRSSSSSESTSESSGDGNSSSDTT